MWRTRFTTLSKALEATLLQTSDKVLSHNVTVQIKSLEGTKKQLDDEWEENVRLRRTIDERNRPDNEACFNHVRENSHGKSG